MSVIKWLKKILITLKEIIIGSNDFFKTIDYLEHDGATRKAKQE
jgi:hypothetical protein